MEPSHFIYFLKVNFPHTSVTPEDALELGTAFKDYLLKTFDNNLEKLKDIWDINPVRVMMNQGHPFKTKGYSPVLILHFHKFCEANLTQGVNTTEEKA